MREVRRDKKLFLEVCLYCTSFFFFYFPIRSNEQGSLNIFFSMLRFVQTFFFFTGRNSQRTDEIDELEDEETHHETICDNNGKTF